MSNSANFDVEQLDKAEIEISDSVGVLRGLASDYSKKCLQLRKKREQQQSDVQRFAAVLDLMSRPAKERSTDVSPPNDTHMNDESALRVARELVTTFKTWQVRSLKNREKQINTIRSSYRRVKQSVISLLTEDHATADSALDGTNPLISPDHRKTNMSSKDKENNNDDTLSFGMEGVALHRAREEALQWRRTADNLHAELSKLRRTQREFQEEEEGAGIQATNAHRLAAVNWRNKCQELQEQLFNSEEAGRKYSFEKEMDAHRTARCEGLEQEVLKLRESLKLHQEEIEELREQDNQKDVLEATKIKFENDANKTKKQLEATIVELKQSSKEDLDILRSSLSLERDNMEREMISMVKSEQERNDEILLFKDENLKLKNIIETTKLQFLEKEKEMVEMHACTLREKESESLHRDTEASVKRAALEHALKRTRITQSNAAANMLATSRKKNMKTCLEKWKVETLRQKRISMMLGCILLDKCSNHCDYSSLLYVRRRQRARQNVGFATWLRNSTT